MTNFGEGLGPFGPNGGEVRSPKLRQIRQDEYSRATVPHGSVRVLAAEIDCAIEEGELIRKCLAGPRAIIQRAEAVYPDDGVGRIMARLTLIGVTRHVEAIYTQERHAILWYKSGHESIGRASISLLMNPETDQKDAFVHREVGDAIVDPLYMEYGISYSGRDVATVYDLDQWSHELQRAQKLISQFGASAGPSH